MTRTWLRGVVISELELSEAANVSVPNTNDMLKPPREFSANVPGPGSVASVTVPVPTNGGVAGGGAESPRLSKSNVNDTAPAGDAFAIHITVAGTNRNNDFAFMVITPLAQTTASLTT